MALQAGTAPARIDLRKTRRGHCREILRQLLPIVREADELSKDRIGLDQTSHGLKGGCDHLKVSTPPGRRSAAASVVGCVEAVWHSSNPVRGSCFLSTAVLPSVIQHVHAWVRRG